MGKAGSSFKKPVVKKTFTKKDIKGFALIAAAIVAVIVVIAILIGTDDFIREKDGLLQMEDNWLIASFTSTGNGGQYYKVGEVGDIEGYTLGEESAHSAMKYLWPVDEAASNVHVIYVGAANSQYEEMASYLSVNTGMSAGVTTLYTPAEMTLCGRDANFVYCVTDPETVAELNAADAAEDEPAEETDEPAETTDEPAETEAPAEETPADETAEETEESPGCIIYACIEYDDERCVYMQINTVGVVTEDEAKALVETVGEAITIEER